MQYPQNLPPEEVATIVREMLHLIGEGEREPALTLIGRFHPADQGEVLMELPKRARQELLTMLAQEETADILEHLEPADAVEISEEVEPQILSAILDETSSDVVADILNDLPPVISQEILENMKEAERVLPLLQYPDDDAGGLMTTDYPVVRQDSTIPNALDHLRLRGPDAEDINTVFVVDEQSRLIGSLSISQLALARPSALVRDIAKPKQISVCTDTDQEECARLMERYDLSQLPVLDQGDRLVGVIMAGDLVDVIEEEATEDMYRMASVSAGERIVGPLHNSLRSRLPWLCLNLATAFMAALVISLFESTIARMAALAVFLPVVAGQGGIGGTQTVTLVVRSMALGEVPRHLGLRILTRELALGLINGIVLGAVVGVVAYAWKGNPVLGIVLALAMLGNMLVAGLSGAGVPLILRRLGMDPAISSAIFVTTFTDVLGFLLFLGLAAAFINLLL